MDAKELNERMQWPLEQKIDHALHTIESFIATLGRDKVYVAFSGGKDSTVLLDLFRMIDKDIPAVFVNTGNEFPDIVYFVRHLRDDLGYNIEIIRPKSTPKQVWARYGFPLVSKAQAEYIHRFRVNPDLAKRMMEKSEGKNWSFGIVSKRWQFLINAPFETSNECCNQLKKKPSHRYERKTGRFPILGTITSESDARRTEYLRRGGGAIRIKRISSEAVSGPLLWPSGRTRISGATSGCATSRLPRFTTKAQGGPAAWDAGSGAGSRRITGLTCSTQ